MDFFFSYFEGMKYQWPIEHKREEIQKKSPGVFGKTLKADGIIRGQKTS